MTVLLKKYGVADDIMLPLVDPASPTGDYLLSTPTLANNDVTLSADSSTFSARSSVVVPTFVGGFVKINLNATDLSNKDIIIKVVNFTGDNEWADTSIRIQTFGHASADFEYLPSDLTAIMGTLITQGSSGRNAGNFSTLFNNSDSASTKKQDNIGDLVSILSTAIAETTGSRLADNFSTLFDNADANTTKILDNIGDLVSILNTAITETTPGRIAGNWAPFFNNADIPSTKIMDEIGVLLNVAANKLIIAGSMKDQNMAPTPDVAGSVYRDLITPQNQVVAKLPAGTISDLAKSTVVGQSVTLAEALELGAAMAHNRMRKDHPSAGKLSLYKDDGITVLTEMDITATDRDKVF